MARIQRAFFGVWIASLSFHAAAEAQVTRPEPWRDWSNLSQLQSGRTVRIETTQPERKLRCRFVSSDQSGITVEHGGKSETIARANVRKVQAERGPMRYAPLIGAAAGGAVFAAVLAKSGLDIVPSGKALFAGVGAGIGALGGLGIRALGRYSLIYEAPKP